MARCNDSRHRGGNALIETALVLVMLILLTFAGMEYGWMFMRLQEVTNAARQGARVGATVDGTTADVSDSVGAAMTAAGLGSSGYTVVTTPTEVGSAAALDTITVNVSVDYKDNLDLLKMPGLSLALPAKLHVTISMVKEGLQ